MTVITKKDKRRLLIWVMLITIITSYLGVFTYTYWNKILENNNDRIILESKYDELLNNEKILSSEVIKLQDSNYVAKFAREKYMYSKEGEIIIRITDN